jgi:hypothetical protein
MMEKENDQTGSEINPPDPIDEKSSVLITL